MEPGTIGTEGNEISKRNGVRVELAVRVSHRLAFCEFDLVSADAF
jgi:hypothetical protein